MVADIVSLREFYVSPLGQTAREVLRRKVRAIWPDVRAQNVLGVGYATPLLRPFQSEANRVLAFMPAAQGVASWPREGPNICTLIDDDALPLPDESVDRVVVMHALEGMANPRPLLREIWRVLAHGGRLLCIVPSRRGVWARIDSTPFGTGQPFSPTQIKQALRDNNFLPERTHRALYMPPVPSRFCLGLAEPMETYGSMLFPGLGGVLLLEASKQSSAPLMVRREVKRRRLAFPASVVPQRPVG